jgi:hypothetical protein
MISPGKYMSSARFAGGDPYTYEVMDEADAPVIKVTDLNSGKVVVLDPAKITPQSKNMTAYESIVNQIASGTLKNAYQRFQARRMASEQEAVMRAQERAREIAAKAEERRSIEMAANPEKSANKAAVPAEPVMGEGVAQPEMLTTAAPGMGAEADVEAEAPTNDRKKLEEKIMALFVREKPLASEMK